jgi:hypothetical protein
LVRTGYGKDTERRLPADSTVAIFDNLADAAGDLIKDLS